MLALTGLVAMLSHGAAFVWSVKVAVLTDITVSLGLFDCHRHAGGNRRSIISVVGKELAGSWQGVGRELV